MDRAAAQPVRRAPERAPAGAHVPGEIGIWCFVAGDLVVFTVFFILIALGNRDEAEVFARSRATLDLRIGLANTVLLLTGSWFVASGVERCRTAHAPRHARYFSLAILCGVAFVANKVFEWGSKIAAGITPATNDFFMYFFVFTGIHLVHVLIGIGVLLLVRHTSRHPALATRHVRTLESGATFWHLVDLLWVFLFALLYLL